MELQDLLPIVLIGGIIQFGSQIYFIYHVWNNDLFSNNSKIKYTILLLLFNLPVAAIYLLSSHKKINSKTKLSSHESALSDKYFFQGIFIFLLIAYLAFSINILVDNKADNNYVFILYLTSLSLLVLFVLNSLKYQLANIFALIMSMFLSALVAILNYFTGDFNSLLIVLAVVAALINFHSRKNAFALSLLTLIFYVASEVLRTLFLTDIRDPDLLIGPFYVNIILILLVFASFFNLKKYIESNTELKNALLTLKEQSLKIEEMSAETERNKITGEIHDNVGHQLTTAIITIESGIKDIKENNPASVKKLIRAKDIVQNSLEGIRTSVKTMNSGDIIDFIDQLEMFLNSVKEDTQLKVNFINEADSLNLLPLQSKFLIQSIKESITNSLKHAQSSQIDILLTSLNNFLVVSISDDGKGSDSFVPGFGLNSMKRNIESIGGTVEFDTSFDEGFSVCIKIPIN